MDLLDEQLEIGIRLSHLAVEQLQDVAPLRARKVVVNRAHVPVLAAQPRRVSQDSVLQPAHPQLALLRVMCLMVMSGKVNVNCNYSDPMEMCVLTWKWNVLWSTVIVNVVMSWSSIPTTAPFKRTHPRRTPLDIFSLDCSGGGNQMCGGRQRKPPSGMGRKACIHEMIVS